MVGEIICGTIQVAIIAWLIAMHIRVTRLDKRERLERGEELR